MFNVYSEVDEGFCQPTKKKSIVEREGDGRGVKEIKRKIESHLRIVYSLDSFAFHWPLADWDFSLPSEKY